MRDFFLQRVISLVPAFPTRLRIKSISIHQLQLQTKHATDQKVSLSKNATLQPNPSPIFEQISTEIIAS